MAGDWIVADGGETLVEGGVRWTIRPSETCQGFSALYRLAENVQVPDEGFPTPEEEFGFGIFRSPAEARLAAGIALAAPDPGGTDALLAAAGLSKEFEDDRRGWWRKPFDGGSLSLHLGSDEDTRDVIVQMDLVTRPGQISLLLLLSHGKADLPFPDEPRAALRMAAAFIATLDGANHLAAPLSDADWESHGSGRGIPPLPVQVSGNPGAWQFVHSVLNRMGEGDRRAILEQARSAAEEGVEADVLIPLAIDALTAYLADIPPELAGRIGGTFARDPEACYAIAAAHHGIEAVRAATGTASGGPRP